MAKGDKFKEPLVSFRDPVTGRPVTRITDIAVHCHHPYFYNRMFTPDGNRLVYISHRTGKPDACLLDIRNGDSLQLTDSRNISGFSVTLSKDGNSLFFSEDNLLKQLDLATLRENILYEQKAPYDGQGLSFGLSDDCSMVLLSQMHKDDLFHGKGGWDFFEPQWRARPRCRLLLVDLSSGTEKLILEERCWLGHPQIRPGHNQNLMYCHEGPGNLVDIRIWLINTDGTCNRPVSISLRDNVKEVVTHEFFTSDGRFIACTYFPGDYGKNGHIFLVDADSLVPTDLGQVHDYSHFYISPDSNYIVGDECRGDNLKNNCIWIFDIRQKKEYPLCLHGASFKPRGKSTQDAHPHPAFSPDGRYVVFTSDRETSPEGNCSVYLANMEI